MSQSLPSGPSYSPWKIGLAFYLLSNLVVGLAIARAYAFNPRNEPLVSFACRWDGMIYARICQDGYSNDPDRIAQVSFPPGYPVAAWTLMSGTGIPAELALLLVSQVCLAGGFVALAAYVRLRWPEASLATVQATMIAFSFYPAAFYFHVALSESPFLLCVLLMFIAMERRQSPLLVAFYAGLATSFRVVGVALLLPLTVYLVEEVRQHRVAIWKAACALPLAVWGLIAFMLYLGLAFGDPLIFVKPQQQNAALMPAKMEESRLLALLTLRPLWCNFDPGSPCWWRNHETGDFWTGIMLGNPLWFTTIGVLVAVGLARGLLNRREGLLTLGLLGIPFVTLLHQGCMASGARYAVVAFPAYLVLGRLLLSVPRVMAFLLVLLSTVLMVVYAFKFSIFSYSVFQ